MPGRAEARPSGTLLSVVVPTYHRPEQLARAVHSVTDQATNGHAVEVIIAVSDPRAGDDVAAADALASADARIRVVHASRPGPAAARNAGIEAARGEVLALLDDDCVAQPGWALAGLRALDAADLVQGRTLPISERRGWERSLWVDRITWLWESCNLFVHRSAVDRAGLFDEAWNPTGAAGRHWGEDSEWGWRLVHQGARPVFAEGALVLHAVEPTTWAQWLRRRTEIRWFPLLLRHAPELRERRFILRYFFNARHVAIVGACALACGGTALRRRGNAPTAGILTLSAAATYLSSGRGVRSAAELRAWLVDLPRRALTEGVEVASLVYGSVRYRRLLL
jgi:glycosyltransferase involved in cell wall biosynthesis